MVKNRFDKDTEEQSVGSYIRFTSINGAIKNNYSLIIKTKEDVRYAYYERVLVEREVMKNAFESLRKAGIPATEGNVKLLVRGHYRFNEPVRVDLTQDEMLAKMNEITYKEMNSGKYPKPKDFGTESIEVGKEYKILKRQGGSNA